MREKGGRKQFTLRRREQSENERETTCMSRERETDRETDGEEDKETEKKTARGA